MDPLSVTASVIAILQLSSKVVSYLTDVKDASSERAMCAIEVTNLHSLLLNLRFHLEGEGVSASWHTTVRALAIENGPLDQFKQALEALQTKMTDGGRLKATKDMLVWKFKKEEIASILGRIERLKTLVEIALQRDHFKLSQAIKDDTQNIKDDTELIKSDLDSIRTHGNNADRRRLLEWISPTNYSAQQSDIINRKQQGTGQWFLAAPEVARWLSEPQGTLLCPGIPGAGKTIVAAIATDHLLKSLPRTSNGVAYIFCNYKAREEQDASKMLAAILKQLAQTQTSYLEPVERLHKHHAERGSRPSTDEIFSALRDVIANYSTVFIVVDALDECQDNDGSRCQFLAKLRDLQAQGDVRLMVTSRSIPEIVDAFDDVPTLEVQASKEDVKRFVAGQLSRLPRCIQRDTELQAIVQESVVKAAGGMFLLAQLYVYSLLDKRRKSEVISALETLGGGFEALDKAYDQAIERIEDQLPGDTALAKRVLSWITNVRRPLTISEICYALAIEPERKDLDPDNIPDIDDLVSVCAGLVTVDEKSKIIRLVHYTTQEYFERIQEVWNPNAQFDIASTCLTYLSFTTFHSSTSDDSNGWGWLRQHPFLGYATQHWGHHALTVQTELRELAYSFLYQNDLVSRATRVMSMLERRANKPLQGRTGLHVMAQFGLQILLAEFLSATRESSTVSIDATDSDDRNPLSLAAEYGHQSVVALLLENGANIEVNCGELGTPLQTAAYHGHEPTVRLLLDSGADINAKGNDGGTALQAASYQGHEQIVRLLLERGADVNADGPEYGSTLEAAVYNSHKDIVKLLLNRGADLPAQSGRWGNGLQMAAWNGYEQLVEFFLDERADIYSKVGLRGDALYSASRMGHRGVVQLLLSAGADVKAQSRKSHNALQEAVFCGDNQVVQLLLDAGADANTPATYFGNVLQAASWCGKEWLVKLLLDAGAEVNAQGGHYGSALQAASFEGHIAVVKLLLDAGADAYAQSEHYGNAFYTAIETCSVPIIRLFLDLGVDVGTRDCHGWTALMTAYHTGNQEVFDAFQAFAYDLKTGWDQSLAPSILTAPRNSIIKISNDRPVVYSGELISKDMECVIQMRAEHPLLITRQFIYFEITIHNAGINSEIGVGLCHEQSRQTGMPGWAEGSWAYHGDDGLLFIETGKGIPFGETYGAGDVIGCGCDIDKNELFFTKNGTRIGCAGKSPRGRLFAVVGVSCEEFEFSVNFGPEGFRYSIGL